MAREPKPWYWKARKTWAVYIDGHKHILGPDSAQAKLAFHNLMGRKPSLQPVAPNCVAALLDDFLTWTEENRSPKTYRGYKDFCQSFIDLHGLQDVSELSPLHVTQWLNSHATWNSTTKRGGITALTRAFNWAMKNRGLVKNPIGGMEKPEAKKRTTVISPEEFAVILANVNDRHFSELLQVSFDLGARPQEIKNLEARHIDLARQRAVLPVEESKGKRRASVIYIPTDRSMGIIASRVKEYPTGKIFRNRSGRDWTSSAVKCRFANLEKKLGKRYRQYDFRHSFITRKLLAGVDSHVVATLANHADTSMIHRVYSAVADDHRFMLDEAKREGASVPQKPTS